MSDWSDVRAAARPAGRDQLLIDGVDRTFFRGAETQWDDFDTYEPFGYGPTALTFPKVHATLEPLGVGELAFLRPNASVVINRRDLDTDELISTDYVGTIMAKRVGGRQLTMEVGGQFSGKASTVDKHQRAFRYVGDVGHLAALCIGEVNLLPVPWNGPVTGVKMVDAAGGMPLLSWASQVCAMSLTPEGVQRTIMPSPWGASTYTFEEKDTTTKHITIFTDDERMKLDLRDDSAEQPNRWFATGVTPGGVRWRNIRYPGLMQGPPAPYPISGGGSFTVGATNADTIDNFGISVLQIKLQQMSYYGWDNPITGIFDAVTAAAVRRLKADVHLTVNSTMNSAAWDRLFDITKTGSSINGAKVFPILEDPRVRKFNYSANGSVIGLNPDYDSTVQPVERNIDFGPNTTKQFAADWCRGEQARANGKNWVGTITIEEFGAWAGEWGPADAATLNANPATGYAGRPDLIIPSRSIRPGWNAWLPLFDGGTTVHISGAKHSRNGNSRSVTLTVDTQARDRIEIAAILSRNAEARRDLRREWLASNRAAKPSGNMTPRDEFFGRLPQNIAVDGHTWVAYQLPAGQSGTINRVHIQTANAKAKFAMVILGEGHSKEAVEAELNRRIGNPLATISGRPWWKRAGNAAWFRKRIILYSAGTKDQPCGFWPDQMTDTDGPTGADITGEWVYDNPFPYLTGEYSPGVVWVGFYADRDTHIQAGQQLWAQEDDVN